MKDLKELLKDLVAFKSYELVEINRCIDYIDNFLTEGGVETKVIENGGLKSLVACIGPKNKKTIIANAHIDVVPSPPDAFKFSEDGDKLTGPGIFDMKASAAVLMQLLVELKDKDLPVRIMAQFVPDEEVGGALGSAYLVEKGYLGDFVMCLEPTHLNISVQSKGCMWLSAKFRGKIAHGSRPWLGESAVEKAFKCYEELRSLPFVKASNQFFKQASATLTKINGGESLNSVPGSAEVVFDVRYLPEQTILEVKKELDSVFKKYGAEWKGLTHGYPVVTEPDNQFVLKLHEITKEKYPESTLFGQDGSSDARFFTPHGIPCVEFGPSGGNQHSATEFVKYSSVVTLKDILAQFFTQLS